MKPTIGPFRAALILSAVITSECLGQKSSQPSVELFSVDRVASDIQRVIPKGWKCIVITEKGKMGHPVGLEEPSFRLDFIKTNETLQMKIAAQLTNVVHPNCRLHFHAIEDREHVLRTIEAERIGCYDSPDYFADTKPCIVVTSWAWINQTFITNETAIWSFSSPGGEIGERVKPLREALKDYCDSLK